MIRIGVVGLGYLGRIHLQVLHDLSSQFLIAGIYDHHTEKIQEVLTLFPNLPSFNSYSDLLDAVDAIAIIASTPAHYQLAHLALEKRKSVFLEKPMCAELHEAQQLVQLVSRQNGLLQVGHVERFNPALQAVLPRLDAQPLQQFRAQRTGPFQQRGAEVSVVLDLMIHDIDLLLSLHSAQIDRLEVKAKREKSNCADEVDATLYFSDGLIATLFASRISANKKRGLDLQTKEYQYELDLLDKKVTIASLKNSETEALYVPMSNALRMQWLEFANCHENKSLPRVGAEAGLQALSLAFQIDQLAHAQIGENSSSQIQ
ncbi:MAG: hypothetical protein RL511_1341 [Bacteroidota bacterium]|jgi:predicted dehydrogenase